MKKKFLLSVLLSFVFYLLSSQIPQGFNYQAIVRNTAGEVLKDKPLKVTVAIKTALTGGIVLWEEYHNVTSNQFGLVSFAVGSGTYVSGVASFDLIDWKAQPLYLKTTVEYPVGTVTEMGTAPILSVPHSLVAKDVEGPIERLGIRGSESSVDSALFEVRNKIGQTVFAVYPEGVRVYVADGAKGKKGGFAVGSFGEGKAESQKYLVVSKDSIRMYLDSNPLTKAKKGGFAVGGYDMSKGLVQNYLDVSEDSVRIYIDNNPLTKGKKGGFAVGSYDMSKNGIQNFFNVAIDTTGIIKPSQNRILWYPQKNAFMTGKVLIENKDSVGVNSFASGFESKAKGKYSQALGYKAIARGDYSTAIGKNAVAEKINSFALGEDAKAMNTESYALGRGANASGYRSFAFGSAGVDNDGNPTEVARALGNYSFAIGQGSRSIGDGSFALGLADTSRGGFSTAIGYLTSSNGQFSTALGYIAYSKGRYSIAIGTDSKAIGQYSTALGSSSYAKGYTSVALGPSNAIGDRSVAMGSWANSNGYASVAMGDGTFANGEFSFAAGNGTIASGQYSVAMGYNTKANGTSSTTLGNNTTAASGYETVIGRFNTTYTPISLTGWNDSDRLFVIGNGTSSTLRCDALVVLKNGNIAIGHASPTQLLDVNGNARFRGVSSGTFGNNLNIMADGTLTTATSDVRRKENICQITDALDRINHLRGVSFTWRNDSSKIRQIGMIAQEVEPIVPEIVFTNPVDGLKGINYSQTSALFVEAIKEQQNQIESQQKEIDELKALVNSLIANRTVQVNL